MSATQSWSDEPPAAAAADPAFDAVQMKLFDDAARNISAHRLSEAIDDGYDKIIANYRVRYPEDGPRVFSGRSPPENLLYMLMAANEQKGAAVVVSPMWPQAYYAKGYFLIELGRLPEAKAALDHAIAMSPQNAQFLAERGNIEQREKNWPAAEQLFRRAETAAREFSPKDVKDKELARAWRGLGYVFVEQNRLDDAERMYRQCLELNANDAAATKELQYVASVKAKQQKAP